MGHDNVNRASLKFGNALRHRAMRLLFWLASITYDIPPPPGKPARTYWAGAGLIARDDLGIIDTRASDPDALMTPSVRESVRQAMRELIDAGAITVVKSGRRGCNAEYRLELDRDIRHDDARHGTEASPEATIQGNVGRLPDATIQGNVGDSPKETLELAPRKSCVSPNETLGPNSRELLTNSSGTQTQGVFDQFWAAYPRKVGKKAAARAFAEATKAVPAERIIEAARRYADDPNRKEQYTTLPLRWLTEGRWDDDPLPARTNGKRNTSDRVRDGLLLAQQLAKDFNPIQVEHNSLQIESNSKPNIEPDWSN